MVTRSRKIGLLALLTAVCLVATPGCKTVERVEAKVLEDNIELAELSEKETDQLGAWVAGLYAGEGGEPPAAIREGIGSAHVSLRAQGALVGEAWGSDGDLVKSVTEALTQAKGAAPAGAAPDMVVLDLAHRFRTIEDPVDKQIYRFASNKRTGIRGIELRLGEDHERVPPTTMLARGDHFKQVVERFFAEVETDHAGFVSGGGKVRVFESQQFIVRLPSGEGVKLLRGNVLVAPSEVTQASTQATVDMMIDWMLTNLFEDGRMTYMWLPSTSQEKPNDNNMIRQWMATNALIKVAQRRQDPALWDRIAKNIDYNLEHFYEQEGEFGMIILNRKVKLGSLSLAAMAIMNHPQRARWQRQEHGLRRTIVELWEEDGYFEGFFKPSGRGGRDGNVQNFYPGETLLLWAQLYRESRDPELLRRFVKSFQYYRAWHLDPSDPDRRRPSFTPWHTQADFILWETLRAGPAPAPAEGAGEIEAPAAEGAEPALTPEGWPVGTTPSEPVTITPEELAAFVFEMNDWLIENMEVWEDSAYDDEKGRFFSRKKNYGGAHASATGVYIEGIIDAYEMAKILGDEAREDRYRKSLSRALRSVMQLQYVDDIDMYYVGDRARTKGGLRTTLIRNEIRVDNVQHVLMGVLKILDRFAAEDYNTD